MDCEFSKRVSAYVDGELRMEESDALREHITGCAACTAFELDVIFLRDRIREGVDDLYPVAQKSNVRRPRSVWNRAVAIPIPVLAAVLLMFIAMGIGVIRWQRQSITTNPPQSIPATPPTTSVPPGDSLARYDSGGRTEILVVRRTEMTR